jgi:hypothetical protein
MAYTRTKTFNAGKSRTGLSTVGYTLTGASRVGGAGITEEVAGSGVYKATITFADSFTGQLLWDTGEGANTRYAGEEINPGTEGLVTLPSPAPPTYGPVGTGSRVVNQDYPTANNLAFQTGLGVGIGGALVRAYLASEYASNPNTAAVRGQTLTLDSGAWANPIDLDPGSYQITFRAEGYQLLVVPLTVS